jgi:Fur family ferric uptake transcriptional regulator
MQKKNYRTAAREGLLAYLQKHKNAAPQTVEDICLGLAAEGGEAGRSSVYRILADLADRGAVRRTRAGVNGGAFLYQLVEDRGCAEHLHLQCLSCGAVAHLRCECSEEISAHLVASHGFSVDKGASVLYGTCAACAGGVKHG